MSFSRLRESRGYSIVASLVVVAILILIVVAIQAILPPLPTQVTPNAMGAEAGTPATQGYATTPATSPSDSVGEVGAKALADQKTQAQKQLAQKCDAAIRACLGNPASCASTKDTKTQQPAQSAQDDCVAAVSTVAQPKQYTDYKCVGKSATVLMAGTGTLDIKSVPNANVAPGICKTVACQPTSLLGPGTTMTSKSAQCFAADLGSVNKDSVASGLTGSGSFSASRSLFGNTFTPDAPLDPSTQSILNAAFGTPKNTDGSFKTDSNNNLPAPASDQISNLANTNPDPAAQHQSQDITAMSYALNCQSNPSPACGNASTLTSGGGPSNPDDYYVLQKDENGKDVWCNSNGDCKSADTFTPSAKQGGPAQSDCKSDSCAGGQQKDDRTKQTSTFTQPPPGNNGNNGNGSGASGGTGGGLGGFLSNLFGGNSGNNNNNANNQPQSPFGGACNTRYVCSGGTLYYQTVGVQYGIPGASCVTQPMQQCQYGCMAVQNTSGSNSTLSEVGTGLQIFSSVLKLFGGGGSNSSAPNTNLASQCAPTAQQAQGYQSPYGTGTDGQQCYQPPQQPDPAQCSAGTWKPTSSTNNGCTTGYQCVPNGNNSGTGTTTTPTAQLSCQPKIADVGTPISFSYACGNATGSTGTGFSTGGALSGTATVAAPTPPSGTNQVSFTLTCVNLGLTASSQCQVQLNKPGIVMITNPKIVKSGDSALIGWVTAGMQSCVVSSPDDHDFTGRNANNTSPSGAATTSPITATSNYRLDCTTLAGGTKTATTTVSIATN